MNAMRKQLLLLFAALAAAGAPAAVRAQQPAVGEDIFVQSPTGAAITEMKLTKAPDAAMPPAWQSDGDWLVQWVMPYFVSRGGPIYMRFPVGSTLMEPIAPGSPETATVVMVISPRAAPLTRENIDAEGQWIREIRDVRRPPRGAGPVAWSGLQLNRTYTSRFEYRRTSVHPYIIACPRNCNDAELEKARKWIQDRAAPAEPTPDPAPTPAVQPATPPAPAVATGQPPSAPTPTPVPDPSALTPPAPAPMGPTATAPMPAPPPAPQPPGPVAKTSDPPPPAPKPPEPKQLRLWITDHTTGKPSATKDIQVAVAATCRELQVRPPRKPLVQGGPIALPQGITADSVCVGIWAPRQTEGACVMAELRHGVLVWPEYLIEHGATVQPCVPRRVRFNVRYQVVPYLGTEADWRDLSATESRALGERVRIEGAVARDAIELPENLIDVARSGDQRIENTRLAIAPPSTYELQHVIGKASAIRTPPHELVLYLQEKFVRLGKLKFEPVNSNREFEERCEPRLQVGKPNDREEWARVRRANPQQFDGEFTIRLSINREDKLYHVASQALANLSVEASERDVVATIFFPRGTACNTAESIALTTDMLAGRDPDAKLKPEVRKVGPSFYVIASHSTQTAQQVGLSPQLSIGYWTQVAKLGQGILAAPKPVYERRAIGLWNESRIRLLDETLLGNRGSPADLPNDIHTKARELAGQTPFDFQVNLEDALRLMTDGRRQDLPRDARVLVVGSRLGPGGTACNSLTSEPGLRYAQMFARARIRIVFIEVAAKQPDRTEVVTGSGVAGLFRCKALPGWKDVAESYVLDTQFGVVTGLMEPNFEVLRKQVDAFFGRGLE